MLTAGSLALNAYLLFTVAQPGRGNDVASAPAAAGAVQGHDVHAAVKLEAGGEAGRSRPALTDPAAVLAQLHELSYPPGVRRRFAEIILDHQFDNLKARAVVDRNLNFWEKPATERLEEARGFNTKYQERTRELLGEDWKALSPFELEGEIRRFEGAIPAAKIKALAVIAADYEQMRSNLPIVPEGRSSDQALAREKRADIEKLLSKPELEAYDLATSESSRLVAAKIASAGPVSSHEFAQLYAVERSFSAGTMTKARRSEEYRRILGDERFRASGESTAATR